MRYALAAVLVLLSLCTTAGAQTRYSVSSALNSVSLQPGQQAVLAIVIDIKDGFHAQSHTPSNKNFIAFDVTLDASPGLKAFAPQYAKGVDETYPALGTLNVYEGRVVTYVPLQIAADAAAGPLKISGKATIQICNDQICFGPEDAAFSFETTIVASGQQVAPAGGDLFSGFDPASWSNLVEAAPGGATVIVEKAGLARRVWFIGVAVVAGIFFNLVPCVLPVLPLKIMGIYEVSKHNRAKCLALGGVFSAGIVTTFAALAIPVFVFNSLQWGELFSNPWFVAPLVLILLAMSLQMFGVFEIALPRGLYKIDASHETYTGNFLFGILTAILSTPCTFGLFGGVIAFAASQGSGALGIVLMMATGLGMALPYLVLSAFPEWAAKFPRTGPWSNLIKQVMGFVLIAVSLYFAQPFFPPQWRDGDVWWAIFAVACLAAIFLVVKSLTISRTTTVLIASTVACLVIITPTLAVTLKLTQHKVAWTPFSDAALAEARAGKQPVIVKYTAAWCANCHTVEARVFGDQDTVDALGRANVRYVKADLTTRDAPGWASLRTLNPAGGIPLTAVYLPGESEPHVLQGIYSSGDLLAVVGRAK